MNKIILTVDQRELAVNAVKAALDKAGDAGVPIGDIKNLITSTLRLGAFPKSDFGKILFTAKTKRIGMRYYAMTAGPKKEKEVKASQLKADTVAKEPYDEIVGDIKDVRVRGALMTIATSKPKKKIVKIRIYYTTIFVFLIPAGLFVAHLLGKI